MSAGGSNKAIFAAFFANLGIAIAKFVGFLITGASSMLAESIHSFADTGNQALLVVGKKRSEREADAGHQFGYGRERFFYSFVVALVLFSLGSLFAIYEGVHKLQHPEEVSSPTVALGILAFGIFLEGFSLRTAIVESARVKGNASWPQFIRRAKAPELPVVLLEDMGAIAGLVIAFTALLAAWQIDPIFDGVGTVIIGGLLGIIAVVLAIEMKSLLIGEPISEEEAAAVKAALGADDDVTKVIHMRTEHMGPDDVLVAAKLGLRRGLSTIQVAETIDRVEAAVRAQVAWDCLIYIEPDIYRESEDGN